MKRGFTMIELIFVIVVLGILAAVALPKFQSVGEQAKESNLKSFTGTMQATVGSSMWSEAMQNNDGNISALGIDTKTDLKKYTDIPKEITDVNISKCSDAAATDSNGTYVMVASSKIGDYYYGITCNTGTPTTAPKFRLFKNKVKAKAVGDDVNTSSDKCILGCE